ncbi:MAG: acylphosphatase [Bacteroidota bacterium]|nr:acylphosphatase [Bacteroidota bacterium]
MKFIGIKIKGIVQGVNFRYSTFIEATALGLKGRVQNVHTDTVYIIAQGSETSLKILIEWCLDGPQEAFINSLEINEIHSDSYSDFAILRPS